MTTPNRWQRLIKRLLRRHGDVKSFDHDLQAAGRTTGVRDLGLRTVPTTKVVGSVSRWRNLRSDFFYKQGKAMTERFVRVGSAMKQGKDLPPLELYKVKSPAAEEGEAGPSEYYVVDGHHRVAMARKLGQDFLDARVVEYQVSATANSDTLPPAQPPVDPSSTNQPAPLQSAVDVPADRSGDVDASTGGIST